ncbi:MAG TPA: hypothetical protein CFH84_08795 [Sulfurimonas sp. UBA12504]|nr:MAG: hypothetical protein A2019_03495 [Sulfurimonas sp. GWF2_37_8]DAB29558.1 MAG TPA: hypothetical protein CFH84_08795 [Sulfurimonas sp. UBA12504]
MNSLKLTNFKAHQDLEEIKFDGQNFLLYGDNGAGKSSLYEALKVVFYRDRLEAPVKREATAENEAEKISEFYREFNNKISNQDFAIQINSQNYNSFNTNNYNVYMLNLDDVAFDRTLKLSTLLEKVFFNFPKSICYGYKDIEQKANTFLESCLEDIRIEIDSSDDYSIKIENTQRNIAKTKELTKYFNEARLNLVIFALLFSAIEVSKNDTKKNILIFDDFITSLDMANRTFLMKHILETFKDFHIVVFTHNVYFYNLIMYLVNDKICTTDKKWQFANLYEIGNEHKIYMNNVYIEVDKLQKEYADEVKKTSPNFTEIGNKLRQKFERLLYEFSKILSVGGVEESNKILEALLDDKNIYLLKHENGSGKDKKVTYKNSNNLVNDLELITTNLTDVQAKINEYKIDTLNEIKKILKTLKLYRKVSMHSLSHGQTGQHNWSDKEIKQTLILLKKLETNINNLTNSTVN